jgi:hypothetical protein
LVVLAKYSSGSADERGGRWIGRDPFAGEALPLSSESRRSARLAYLRGLEDMLSSVSWLLGGTIAVAWLAAVFEPVDAASAAIANAAGQRKSKSRRWLRRTFDGSLPPTTPTADSERTFAAIRAKGEIGSTG